MYRLMFLIAILSIATFAIAADEKVDGGPIVVNPSGALDCSSTTKIVCNGTTGASTLGAGNVTNYSCTTLGYGGAAEEVYELILTGTADFTIQMDYTHTGSNDLDLFVLQPCDEGFCIGFSGAVSGTEIITGTAIPAGTYYIVVDGWNGNQDGSAHTITVTSNDCSVPVTPASWGDVKSQFVEE